MSQEINSEKEEIFKDQDGECLMPFPVTEKFLLVKVLPFVWIARSCIKQIAAVRVGGSMFELKIQTTDGEWVYPSIEYEEEELDSLVK